MGQYAVRYSESIIDDEGNAIKDSAFSVFRAGTSTVVSTYTGEDKSAFLGTHVTDQRGFATFWVDPGTYDLRIGNVTVPLSTLAPDDRDQLDVTTLGVLVARLLPDTGKLDETQIPDSIRNAASKPVIKEDLASDVRVSLAKADTALQVAPVTSVNNQTGDVTISVGSGTVGDATNVNKGLIQLPGTQSGGLGGTASNPTVVGWSSKADVTAVNTALSNKTDITDARLSDSRNPLLGSVTNASVAANAGIAIAKIAGLQAILDSKAEFPAGGWELEDFESDVQALLALAGTAVQRVNGKIVATSIPGYNPRLVTGGTTAAYNDFISVDATAGDATVVLPTATAGSLPITVRKHDTTVNTVIVSGIINGDTNHVLTVQHETVTLVPATGVAGFWIV